MSNGEVCDDGADNGQPGKCRTNCTPGVQPPVSCDNMTATPLSGAAPLNVAVACTGTNAATYRIDCGNGITNLTNTAVCRYPTMGTYTPRCYVNGNVTSAACAKTITVTPPVACVPGTTTGPQAAPLTAASPGLCPGAQTVGGFTGTTVGTLTTYNWSCNGSAVGGACAATFNSSTAAAGVDLSLKKYAS